MSTHKRPKVGSSISTLPNDRDVLTSTSLEVHSSSYLGILHLICVHTLHNLRTPRAEVTPAVSLASGTGIRAYSVALEAINSVPNLS